MKEINSLFRLPHDQEEILVLIREQLKSHRFFRSLETLGVVDTRAETHLEDLILKKLGIPDSDEAILVLNDLLDKHLEKLNDNASLGNEALALYAELVEWRRALHTDHIKH